MAKAKIMVVEDEELVAFAIKSLLEGIGYEVPYVLSSGEEAVREAGETEPDLILMDIHLNGRMSGIEAAGIIKDSYRLPVVYLTAYSDADTLDKAKRTEPYGFVLKPYDEHSLEATIEMALHKSSVQNELRRTKEQMAAILRSVGDGIIVTGVNGMVEYINPTASRLLEYFPPPALDDIDPAPVQNRRRKDEGSDQPSR